MVTSPASSGMSSAATTPGGVIIPRTKQQSITTTLDLSESGFGVRRVGIAADTAASRAQRQVLLDSVCGVAASASLGKARFGDCASLQARAVSLLQAGCREIISSDMPVATAAMGTLLQAAETKTGTGSGSGSGSGSRGSTAAALPAALAREIGLSPAQAMQIRQFKERLRRATEQSKITTRTALDMSRRNAAYIAAAAEATARVSRLSPDEIRPLRNRLPLANSEY